jgi:hypothetical protein
MEYINPLFNNTEKTKEKRIISDQPKSNSKTKTIRATRSDKKHNVKFPVTPIIQMKLKSYCKQANRIYRLQGIESLTQTKFNTLILQYGLKHKELINWNHEYKDTKVYMHTNILEIEYEREIGGPHGLAIQKNISERKIVFQVVHSVLKWVEGEGSIEKIL